MMFYPVDPTEQYGLFAIRFGKYKAHFYTQGRRLHLLLIRPFLSQIWLVALFLTRCYPQQLNPRPRLPSDCHLKASWPSSYFRPGGRPLWELPALAEGPSACPSRAGGDHESEGRLWSHYGVWSEPGIEGNRSGPGAVLQPWVQPPTQLLPLLKGQLVKLWMRCWTHLLNIFIW